MRRRYEFVIIPINGGKNRAKFMLNGLEAEAFFRSIAKELSPRDPFLDTSGTTVWPLLIRYRRIR